VIWNGFVVAPETAISQVEAVLPGELRLYDSQGQERERRQYWSLQSKELVEPLDEAELGAQLARCVRLHLASDAPLGIFLSGGVDSSAVANLAQQAAGETINTFTLAFEEEKYNEGEIARQIAAAIGTRHYELVLTEHRFTNELEAALEALDQPTFDGINSYYMSHAVREAGLKVALVGTGGDELFGGYATFRDLPLLHSTGWIPQGLRTAAGKAVAAMMQWGGPMPPQTRWAKLPEMLLRSDELLALYQMAYALFLPKFQRRLLGDGVASMMADGLPPLTRSRILAEADGRPTLSAISVLEQRLFLGERLLRDTDAASMSASIEVRVPLVDQLLTRYVDRLPLTQRFSPVGKKSILRRLGLRGLDAKLFERPKSGFVLPYDRWLRSTLGKVVDATLRDPSAVTQAGLNPEAIGRLWSGFLSQAPGIYWSRIWAVYVLVRWCQRRGAAL